MRQILDTTAGDGGGVMSQLIGVGPWAMMAVIAVAVLGRRALSRAVVALGVFSATEGPQDAQSAVIEGGSQDPSSELPPGAIPHPGIVPELYE